MDEGMKRDTEPAMNYRLADNRSALHGRVFLTGTQALVRLLLLQRTWDAAHGLKTAGFVSGYRGSPLAGVDVELWRAEAELQAHDIRFLPAVNEDLAATALMGTQQVGGDAERNFEGVFGMWYGKGPGLDRAGDALRHGNAAGTTRAGGVLVVVGDDHAAVSSSIPNASELSLMGWGMPIIHPASVDEYDAFGLWGWAASRHAGTWVAFKAISETVESGRSVEVAPLPEFTVPDEAPGAADARAYRSDDFLTPAIEVRLAARLEALKAFARLNSIDRLVAAAPGATTGIVAVGKSFHDLMEVLQRCGIDEDELQRVGLRIYKPGLVFPLESHQAQDFCAGLRHVLVIEEKASVVEQQLKELVFNREQRPTVCGKHDLSGVALLTWVGQLGPAAIATALRAWLASIADPLAPRIDPGLFAKQALPSNESDGMRRLPYFCSGCPHSSSTKVPEGSKALAGVGCHYMASWMERSTGGLTQMGGEGADWLGHAPFTAMPHVFQNMGEGTYFHSGYLAIRQAIASGANITYKILFNDAVAMTGGQPVDGSISVPQICTQVASEGAKRVVVVTDDPQRYRGVRLEEGVQVHHRRELDAVQRALREIAGVTVLVYDQTCAAEKRRRRKKKSYPDPAKRMFINAAVCEGCGDCGVQSNCFSVAPLETEFGRKRQIEQSSCNKDYSCAEGFCPSFVTVLGGELRKSSTALAPAPDLRALAAGLPLPVLPAVDKPFDMMVAGVGGTGVITIGALVAMAAHLEGKGVSVLDFTALAQKGGSVVSHIRVAAKPQQLHAVRLQPRRARTLIVADMVVGTLPDVLGTVQEGATQVVVNSHLQTLAEFTRSPDLPFRHEALLQKFQAAAGVAQVQAVDAHDAAKALLGDAIGANMLLLGYAWQRGGLPVGLDALMRAVELNGVAVEANRKAFAAGRLAAHDPAWKAKLSGHEGSVVQLTLPQGLEKIIETRVRFLEDYQSMSYARRYLDFVRRVEAAERAAAPVGQRLRLTEAVARNLFKLMAYKDEYEVARLYTRPEFLAELGAQFEGDVRLQFNLAPPLLAKRNAEGLPMKRAYGQWVLPMFKALGALRRLRGTPLDPFGYAAERRQERQLIGEYRQLVERLVEGLSADGLAEAARIAGLAEKIRGYGHVKDESVRAYRKALAAALGGTPAGRAAPALKIA
ncbi:indolepyruvate ferredoxin oxidoreductase family protein [Variovorax paradoxus]|nr:indolepyruvate ferredoxin oxidoreductase family protein [Variovorax paradoxus]